MKTLEYRDSYEVIALGDLVARTREYKEAGYRLVQLLPKMQEDGKITLVYTFNKLNEVVNLKIPNIVKHLTAVPSITSLFISAFVFENEAHDLFGVKVVGNSLDFQGHFYTFGDGVEDPMTIVTPAQLAAREKKAKLEAAKKAKAAKAAKAAAEAQGTPGSNGTDATESEKRQVELEARLAGMDPEKAAKVRAAMEAKAKCDAAAAEKDAAEKKAAELEARLAGMDPEKAAKVRAAMEAKAKREAAQAKKEGE